MSLHSCGPGNSLTFHSASSWLLTLLPMKWVVTLCSVHFYHLSSSYLSGWLSWPWRTFPEQLCPFQSICHIVCRNKALDLHLVILRTNADDWNVAAVHRHWLPLTFLFSSGSAVSPSCTCPPPSGRLPLPVSSLTFTVLFSYKLEVTHSEALCCTYSLREL